MDDSGKIEDFYLVSAVVELEQGFLTLMLTDTLPPHGTVSAIFKNPVLIKSSMELDIGDSLFVGELTWSRLSRRASEVALLKSRQGFHDSLTRLVASNQELTAIHIEGEIEIDMVVESLEFVRA